MTSQHTNWAGNYRYKADRVLYPASVEEIQALMGQHRRVKALGTRHAFNDIADTSDVQISLANLHRIVALDREGRTVTVEGGVRYGELSRFLHGEGFALHNLASLPHISVAGACATATHGSGSRHGNLATIVSSIELVTADGARIVRTRDDHPDFPAIVVGLGGFGIVTKLTLDLVPAFEVRQFVYEHLPLAQVDQHFDAILGCGYSVSLFTDWSSATINQIWVKDRIGDNAFEAAPKLWGATLATRRLHPLAHMPAHNCTEQLGIPGPWYDRLPHFRLEHIPSSGEELQSEYFVPQQDAPAALHALNSIRDRIAPLLQISEIRTVAADKLWMSPCYEQDSVAFHFTWKQDWPAVREVLPMIEARLALFGARTHWGKLFTMSAIELRSRFPRLPEFQTLLREYDPEGKFRNEFLDRYIVGPR